MSKKKVLNRTFVDSDWRFDNLCGSHLSSCQDGYCDYCTGCRNSHCQKQSFQNYVHPDDLAQPTYEINNSWVQTFHIRERRRQRKRR